MAIPGKKNDIKVKKYKKTLPSQSQRHNFSQTNNFSQIIKFGVTCGIDKQNIVPDKYDTSNTGFSNYPWATMTMIDDIL